MASEPERSNPTHIGELKPDDYNFREGTPRGIGMIVDSLQDVGAARSIVIDEDDVVLAGNKTLEAAAEAGITKVQVVEADGETLIARWITAARGGLLPKHLRSVVVTGPMMPEDAQLRIAAAAPASVTVTRFIGGLEAYLVAADLLVGMAGYNTSCEVLGARTAAVLVPRASQRDEQRIRAARLAERGLVDMVDSTELTPETLAAAAIRSLARGRRTTDCDLALDGYSRVVSEIARVLPARPVPPPTVLRELSA